MHPSRAARENDSWLTALLRPVGDLDGHTSARLDEALRSLTRCASMVIVDLDAARVIDAEAGRVLARAAERLGERDGMLLLVNARESDRAVLSEVGRPKNLSIAERLTADSSPETGSAAGSGTTALFTADDELYAMPLD